MPKRSIDECLWLQFEFQIGKEGFRGRGAGPQEGVRQATIGLNANGNVMTSSHSPERSLSDALRANALPEENYRGGSIGFCPSSNCWSKAITSKAVCV
jgi:hypothetical protein